MAFTTGLKDARIVAILGQEEPRGMPGAPE
jgi:hypothetical protein